MERATKLFVQRIGERWTFGREGTAFEIFPTKDLALARAREFARQHCDEVVVLDPEDREHEAETRPSPKKGRARRSSRSDSPAD